MSLCEKENIAVIVCVRGCGCGRVCTMWLHQCTPLLLYLLAVGFGKVEVLASELLSPNAECILSSQRRLLADPGGSREHAQVSKLRQVCRIQWNLSIKDTLNKGHLSNEDTVCSPNYIELCTDLPLN